MGPLQRRFLAVLLAIAAFALNPLWVYLGFKGDVKENTAAIVLLGSGVAGLACAVLHKLNRVGPGPFTGENAFCAGLMGVGFLIWGLDVTLGHPGAASLVGFVTAVVALVFNTVVKNNRVNQSSR